jgi:hypothetical protein
MRVNKRRGPPGSTSGQCMWYLWWTKWNCMRFEVLTTMNMPMLIFWVVTLCEENINVSEAIFCLQLQGSRWRHYVLPKRWYLPTSPHGFTLEKTIIDIFILSLHV